MHPKEAYSHTLSLREHIMYIKKRGVTHLKTVTKREAVPAHLLRRKRVAAYTRTSCGKDAMMESLSAQVSYYSDLIQKNPAWIFAGVYTDEAVTGTKDKRAQFQRLLADCRAGMIDLVITKSISRFARNTVTLLETVRELKALGVDVYFEEQKIHTMSGDGELMLSVLASYAQEECFYGGAPEDCSALFFHCPMSVFSRPYTLHQPCVFQCADIALHIAICYPDFLRERLDGNARVLGHESQNPALGFI